MILLGITGSIATYKAVEVLRLLTKAGQDVHVLMTEAAAQFVGPLTFQALSGHPVLTSALDPKAYQMAHLHLAEEAKAIVVVPASAESLSQLAHGGASNLVAACVLSAPRTPAGKLKTPVFIAPAMHEAMWMHPATQANVKALLGYGYRLIGPVKGPLGRVGDSGHGRLADPSVIAEMVLKSLDTH
jgi:phosphopantothenoylcysteine decarboxylase / phosphopantothenate---cysteine ligase